MTKKSTIKAAVICNADYFNERAAAWDGMVHHDPAKVSAIIAALNIGPADAVLDVGCGTGVLAPYLHDKCGSVLAVDEAEKMIEVAASKYQYTNVEFKTISFEKLAGKFDKIIMYSVFPHFEDKKAAIVHAASLLKRGGRVMIAHSQSRERINSRHVEMGLVLPSPDEFTALFSVAGLTVTACVDTDEMFYVIGEKG